MRALLRASLVGVTGGLMLAHTAMTSSLHEVQSRWLAGMPGGESNPRRGPAGPQASGARAGGGSGS
jgi:hypothetical protein